VTALAERLGKYVSDHDAVTGRITAGTFTFTVVADRKRTGEVLALWRSLAADDRAVGGDIDDVFWKDTDRWEAEITAVDAAGAMAVFKDVTTDGDRHRPLSDVTSLKVATKQGARSGLSVETGFDGDLPAEAIAAYEAVAARYPVVRTSMTPDRASIVVAESADLTQAGELARKAAPNLGPALRITTDN
jgi:hypothetical protein